MARRIASLAVALMLIAGATLAFAPDAPSTFATQPDQLTAQEAAHIGAMLSWIEIVILTFDDVQALFNETPISNRDAQWTYDLAAATGVWSAIAEQARQVTPPPRLVEIHDHGVEGWDMLAEAGDHFAAAAIDGDVTRIAEGNELSQPSLDQLEDTADMITAFLQERPMTGLAVLPTSGPSPTPAVGEEDVSTQTLTGDVRLTRLVGREGSPCFGYAFYEDYRPGIDVIVEDDQGTVLAIGSLEEGVFVEAASGTGTDCLMPFTVEVVPMTDFYTIHLGERGGLRSGMLVSYEELVELDWHLSLIVERPDR